MKKVLTLAGVLFLVLSSSACADKKKLVVWTFTQVIPDMINDYYLRDKPDLGYEVEVVVIPHEQFQTKLDPVLQSGKEAPDVFTLEYAFVRKYVESAYTMDLAKLNLDTGSVLEYVKQVGSDGSTLKGLSWQATPGAFFYRRSLAATYLGSGDPATAQAEMENWDEFLALARKLNTDSNGTVKILSTIGDLSEVFLTERSEGWVVDGELTIDPMLYTWMDISKTLIEEGLTWENEQWTEAWFTDISEDETFGYFLPTWGLAYVLKTNSKNEELGTDTAGDWGMVQGPAPYFWGGTWLAIREGSPMADEAADLISYITLNEDFLEEWAADTGDFLGNANVVAKIKDTFSEPFLDGQNHYQEFFIRAQAIEADTLTGYDLDMRTIFVEELGAYSKGEKTREQALADFKTRVQSQFADVIVN